jgi:hypothetical protein
MFDFIRERRSGFLLFGITPPKKSTPAEKVDELTLKTISRVSSLPIDALILYDIQDEKSRNPEERPFPFMETIDPYYYAERHLKKIQIPKIIYRASGKYSPDDFSSWIESIETEKYASVFVGSPTSVSSRAMSLAEAYQIRSLKRSDLLTGAVLIPERHEKKGDEHLRMMHKIDNGCSFFVTQCVYSSEASKNLLSDYYYESLKHGKPLVPVVFTLTVCGSEQTLNFMKWLGIHVPRWLENDLVHSGDILSKSMEICRQTARDLCVFCAERGIPYGINVESVSIRKQEIEASLDLVKDVKAILDEINVKS